MVKAKKRKAQSDEEDSGKKQKKSESTDGNADGKTEATETDASKTTESQIWSKPVELEEEKTREAEFEEYLDDLFL